MAKHGLQPQGHALHDMLLMQFLRRGCMEISRCEQQDSNQPSSSGKASSYGKKGAQELKAALPALEVEWEDEE